MTREQFFEFQQAFYARNMEITRAKNADYSGAASDPFANFVRVEQLGIASTEQGFLTRMTDKLCRLASFVKNGELQVKDESVTDTLADLANYCSLMAGYLHSKKLADDAMDAAMQKMSEADKLHAEDDGPEVMLQEELPLDKPVSEMNPEERMDRALGIR